jgi:hypothetical protein
VQYLGQSTDVCSKTGDAESLLTDARSIFSDASNVSTLPDSSSVKELEDAASTIVLTGSFSSASNAIPDAVAAAAVNPSE